MPTAPAPKRRPPGPVRRPILAKPSATKQRKAAPGKPGTRQATTRLEQPAAKKQRKGACPKCEEAAKSGKAAPCPTCNVSPELERPPVPSMKGMASDAHHPAERQAEAIGARIGASLGSLPSFGPGPLPDHARSAAESHLGVSLAGTQLRADRGAQRKAANESAFAVTEGRTVSFAAGQFSSSTSAGRALIGHELTHVGQQALHGAGQSKKAARGCEDRGPPELELDPKTGKPPLIYNYKKVPWPGLRRERSMRPSVGYAQEKLNIFLADFDRPSSLLHRGPELPRFPGDVALAKTFRSLMTAGELAVDCWFGDETELATKTFQAAMGLEPDGKIGPLTWPALILVQRTLAVLVGGEIPSAFPFPNMLGIPSAKRCRPSTLCKGSSGSKSKLFTGNGGTFRVCELQGINKIKSGTLFALPPTVTVFGGHWEFDASVAACLPNSVPDKAWEWGFIQTVEKLRMIAEYSLGWEEHHVVPVPARDADGPPPAPWYSSASRTDWIGTSPALLADTPFAKFPDTQPRTKRQPNVQPCAQIEKIREEGVFHVWLVVRRTDLPMPASLTFLKHIKITFKDAKSAKYSVSLVKPHATVSDGQGTATPVLSGILASKYWHVPLTFPGQPCPLKLPKKTK